MITSTDMRDVSLSIGGAATLERRADLTRDLVRSLRAEEVDAHAPAGKGTSGERGAEAIMAVVVPILSGGVGAALLEVLKAFVQRDKSISIELSKGDRKFLLTAKNGSVALEESLAVAREFLDEPSSIVRP